MGAKQISILERWTPKLAGAAWRVVRVAGAVEKFQVIFDVGKMVVMRLDISQEVKDELENMSLIECLFECGKLVKYAKQV